MIDEFGFRIDIFGEARRENKLSKIPTKERVLRYIESRNYEQELKRRLTMLLFTCPSNVLDRFVKDIDSKVIKIRRDIENEAKRSEGKEDHEGSGEGSQEG